MRVHQFTYFGFYTNSGNEISATMHPIWLGMCFRWVSRWLGTASSASRVCECDVTAVAAVVKLISCLLVGQSKWNLPQSSGLWALPPRDPGDSQGSGWSGPGSWPESASALRDNPGLQLPAECPIRDYPSSRRATKWHLCSTSWWLISLTSSVNFNHSFNIDGVAFYYNI